ncbi:AAA family ATPase [Phormidium tenue]|uniref:AAA+ ATPase domain-containing protein n=1 Tax=Phormidium tenue NIES-30 TaxID=549789 RepID=A0A1U7IZ02_9CYAN|nr:AAA family ATPase [Phormidium tenue]MBD2234615.1 ATP-binding protein [Phormidium tenue FACHB-1052]OKH44197.1 hypothetical protein NIES30_23140 [Phormidium tenue NIES-30]
MPFLNPKLGIDFSNYIADRTLNFTGREWVFEAIQSWLADSNGDRFFLLTGEPGSGKTAIAARLAQFANGEKQDQKFDQGFLTAIHFCSARYSTSVDPKNFTESIALQLAQIPAYANLLKEIGTKQVNIQITQNIGIATNSAVQGVVINNLDVSGVMSAQEAFNLVVLNPLESLYQQGFNDPLVLLVDSLDEALTHVGETKIVDLLSRIPPSVKARFILTSRKETQIESELTGVRELFLSATEFETRNREDITVYVKHRLESLPLPAQTTNDTWRKQQATKISELSEENFLYARFLLDAISSGQQSITELDRLPKGLEALYFDSLRRVVKLGKKDWGSIYAPCLGILSVAQESLTISQIQAFTHNSESLTLECLSDLRQFVDEIKPEKESLVQKYKLYHQSVIDFLGKKSIVIDSKEINNPYYTPEKEQYDRILQSYCPLDKAWKDIAIGDFDEYGLRHLTQHLVKAERTRELHDLLAVETITKRHAWFEAKDQIGDLEGFLTDIALAWGKAEEEFQLNPERAISLQCRYALITTSVGKLASNISNSLLINLVKAQVWTERKALSYVKQIPDPKQRLKTLMSLTPNLVSEPMQQTGWQEALNASLSIKDQEKALEALKELFPNLPECLKKDALEVALNPPSDNSRGSDSRFSFIIDKWTDTLLAIIPCLSETLAAKAFTTLIGTRSWRVLIDSPHLSDSQWLILWQKELEVKYVWRSNALDEGAWFERALFSDKFFETGLHQVAGYGIFWETRIAAHLSQFALSDALRILSEVSEINQVAGLTALVPHLSLSFKQDALAIALRIQDDELRMWALRFLVVYLNEPEQLQSWQKILELTSTLKLSKGRKLRFFVDLALCIPVSLQQQAWQEALDIFVSLSDSERWNEANKFISYIPDIWKRDLLNRILALSSQYSKRYALLDLVPHLPVPLRQEALDAALSIPAQQVLADKIQRDLGTTIELPGLLGQAGKKVFDVATTAFSSFSEYETLESLCNISDYLPESLKQSVLSDVLKVKKEEKQSGLLQKLFPNSNEAQKQQVLHSILKYRNESEQSKLFQKLLLHLDEAQITQILQFALKYRNENGQSGLFQQLLPYLNEVQRQQVLQSALRYRNEHEKAWLLYAILPYLLETQKQQILSELLKLTMKLNDEKSRVSLLRNLIPSLAESVNQQLLDSAFSIKDGVNRLNLLYSLFSRIPESSKLKLLKAVEEIQEDEWRAEGLQHLTPRLANELQQEALRIVKNIKDQQVRSQALEKISVSLPEPLKQQTLKDALNSVLAIGDEKWQGILVHSLSNSLASSLVQTTLKTFAGTAAGVGLFFEKREKGQEYGRKIILEEFERAMPSAIKNEILQEFLASKNDSELVDIFLNPVKNLPQSVRPLALQEYIDYSMKSEDGSAVVIALEVIVPQLALLPTDELYTLWCHFLKNSVNRPRSTFLMFLHPFVKVISMLGGKDTAKAVTLAIRDVGHWWP